MSYQCVIYNPQLPNQIITEVENEISANVEVVNSSVDNFENKILLKSVRSSKHAWISTDYWIASHIWFYIQKANESNFLYDITKFENDVIQYTTYDVGDHYNWHVDYSISTNINKSVGNNFEENTLNSVLVKNQEIRKLSFVMQLSDPSDYEGGELQFLDDSDNIYYAPKEKGTIIVFDSRTKHRVRKIKKGFRKSIVGWVMGPRWK